MEARTTKGTEDVLDAFQLAVALEVRLSMTPTWRWLKRRRIERMLERACALADIQLRNQGADDDARPLIEIFREQRSGQPIPKGRFRTIERRL